MPREMQTGPQPSAAKTKTSHPGQTESTLKQGLALDGLFPQKVFKYIRVMPSTKGLHKICAPAQQNWCCCCLEAARWGSYGTVVALHTQTPTLISASARKLHKLGTEADCTAACTLALALYFQLNRERSYVCAGWTFRLDTETWPSHGNTL